MPRKALALPLHEEVALLALKNDRGTVAGGVMYAQAAGGAILAELLLSGHLATEGAGRKMVVVPGRDAHTGNEVLDECLDKVTSAKRRGRLSSWVEKFSNLRRLHHRVASSLVAKGVLREDEGRVLFLFKRRDLPAARRRLRAGDPRADRSGDFWRRGPCRSAHVGPHRHRPALRTAEDELRSKAAEAAPGKNPGDCERRCRRRRDETGDRGRSGRDLVAAMTASIAASSSSG